MAECGFGVVFCWQKCRHCTFPVKKDPKSFLLNSIWCHRIFSSHTTRAVSAGEPWDNLHSFIYCTDQFFTILRVQWPQRPVWLSLSPPPARRQELAERHSQAPFLWAAGERKAGQAEFSPCFHSIGAALEASAVFVSGTGSSPGLFCRLLGEGMVHSYAVDLWSQFPLTVLIFFLKVHSAKLEKKTPHDNWKEFLQRSFLQEFCRDLRFTR